MSETKLTYKISAPPAAFISTKVDLVVTATNDTGKDISFGLSDEIQISFPVCGSVTPCMVESLNFTSGVPDGVSNYTNQKSSSGSYFSVKGYLTLHDGDSMIFKYNQVPIGGTPGQPSITVTEEIGGQSKTTLAFTIKPLTADIIVWAAPMSVGAEQMSTLFFYPSQGDTVTISGFEDGDITKKVQVSPPKLYSVKINIPNGSGGTSPQRKYTATLYSGQDRKASGGATLTGVKPHIFYFNSDPDTLSIPVNAIPKLQWKVQYASAILLTTPSIPVWRQLNNPDPDAPIKFDQVVSPGMEMLNLYRSNFDQLPSTAAYLLTANGYGKSKVNSVAFTLQSVKLKYLKYQNKSGGSGKPTFSNADFALVIPEWKTTNVSFEGGGVVVLTYYQPGGKAEKYYLGDADKVHPQIQYFNSTPKSGQFELEWYTANLTKLVLNGTVQSKIASGTATVAAGIHTLVGTAANGETVQSVLVLKA